MDLFPGFRGKSSFISLTSSDGEETQLEQTLLELDKHDLIGQQQDPIGFAAELMKRWVNQVSSGS